jgi:hypothetical protein
LYEATGQTFEQSEKEISLMSDNNDKGYDEIGYSKPPKDTRFPKGVSGNLAGRPRGVPNWATTLMRILQEKDVITKNGVTKEVTNREIILRQLKDKAKSGDLGAMSLLFNLEARAEVILSGVPKKMRVDDSNQLPKGTGGTGMDSGSYVIPSPVLALRLLSTLKVMYGVKVPGALPISIISENGLKELTRNVQTIYGFPVSEEEAVQLANDALLIEATEQRAGRRPEEP